MTARSWKAVSLPFGLALGVLCTNGCSSASGAHEADAGGTGDGDVPRDARPNHVATSDAHAGKPDAHAKADAHARDAGPPFVYCYVRDGGAGSACQVSASGAAGFSCASVAGSTIGMCPKAGLSGCCVMSPNATGPTLTASCYYGDAGVQEANCENEAYEGFPASWGPTAPGP